MSHEHRSGIVVAGLTAAGCSGAPRPSTHSVKFVLLLLWFSILLAALLGGCSHPGPAPVVSREYRQPVTKTSSGYYRVRRGDTMYSIAWRFGYDHRRMAAWNGIRPPYTIYPGQLIRTRPPARVSTARSSRPTRSSSATTRTTTAKNSTSAKKVTPSKNTASKQVSNVKLRWQWPTKGRVIQSFSSKDPNRKGIKLAGSAGEAVHAAEAGRVVYSGSGLIGYGMLIIVKHNNDYLSAYGHNRKLLVKEGDQVKRGTRIAEMGKSGTGQAMLHFEIRRNGNPVNPVVLLPRRR